MKKGFVALMIACLSLSSCSIASKPNPQSNDYAVSFSPDDGPRFLTPPKTRYQAQFKVNVSKWSQDFDIKNCEVFLIVTNKSTPVVDLETDNANNFAYGGWFNLDAENPVLESLGLKPIQTATVANNWFNVVNTTQATARFDVRTNKPVNLSDWRFVIIAIRGEQGKVKVLWTKVVSPT